jgi:hypothetical protein
MTVAAANAPELVGSSEPRVAPPMPLVSLSKEFEVEALAAGIKLLPWQSIASRYITATHGEHWQYAEVSVVVARQNGKTKLLVPHVLQRLGMGRKILHTAQNRTLPRQVFMEVARSLDPARVFSVRYANGQEEIRLKNGGTYMIVAPQRGARGLSADDLIIDEVREFEDFDILAAATPTLTASPNPQTLFLSNAGSDESVILNDLKRRGEDAEPTLAYLEWSAAEHWAMDDKRGWAEANPSLGYFPGMLKVLEDAYASRPPALFETEHLCRWVVSMQPRLVLDAKWELCRGKLEEPNRPAMALSMSPDARRASFALAWQQSDGRIALTSLIEAKGEPIDTELLGKDAREKSTKAGVKQVGFASWTDADLARHFTIAKPLDGKEFAAATENFVRLIESGRLIWDGAEHVSEDLPWTARKPHDSGAWIAVPASERPIPSVLAAIRATWLASAPRPPAPRIG